MYDPNATMKLNLNDIGKDVLDMQTTHSHSRHIINTWPHLWSSHVAAERTEKNLVDFVGVVMFLGVAETSVETQVGFAPWVEM